MSLAPLQTENRGDKNLVMNFVTILLITLFIYLFYEVYGRADQQRPSKFTLLRFGKRSESAGHAENKKQLAYCTVQRGNTEDD